MSEKKYFLVENGRETGPFTDSQMRTLIEAREVFSETVCIPTTLLGKPGPLSEFFSGTTPNPKSPPVPQSDPNPGNPVPKKESRKMYCRNCSKEIDERASVCVGCGVPPRAERKFCPNCGAATEANQTICIKCGVPMGGTVGPKSKSTATLLGLFLGGLGAQKFYMGSWGWGIIYLVLCISFFLAWIPWILALVENVRIILMTDDEFAVKAAAFEGQGPFGFFW